MNQFSVVSQFVMSGVAAQIRYYVHFRLTYFNKHISDLVSSVRRALASKLRGLGFKSRPGTVGGPVTIIMWDARPGWKVQ